MKTALSIKDALNEASNMIKEEVIYGSFMFTTFVKNYKLQRKNGKFNIYDIKGHLIRHGSTLDYLTTEMGSLELHDHKELRKQQESIIIH
ncbi:hypothetical protein bcgnr5378_07940 [Bacillus cereus]